MVISNLPPGNVLLELLGAGAVAPRDNKVGSEAVALAETKDKAIKENVIQFYRSLHRNATELLLECMPPPKEMIHRLLSMIKPPKVKPIVKVEQKQLEKKGEYFDPDEYASDCESLGDSKENDDEELKDEQQDDDLDGFIVPDDPPANEGIPADVAAADDDAAI